MFVDVKDIGGHRIKMLAVKLCLKIGKRDFGFKHSRNGKSDKIPFAVQNNACTKAGFSDLVVAEKCGIILIPRIEITVVALEADKSRLQPERQVLLIEIEAVRVRTVHFSVAADADVVFHQNQAEPHTVVQEGGMSVQVIRGGTSIETCPLLAIRDADVKVVIQPGIGGVDEHGIAQVLGVQWIDLRIRR